MCRARRFVGRRGAGPTCWWVNPRCAGVFDAQPLRLALLGGTGFGRKGRETRRVRREEAHVQRGPKPACVACAYRSDGEAQRPPPRGSVLNCSLGNSVCRRRRGASGLSWTLQTPACLRRALEQIRARQRASALQTIPLRAFAARRGVGRARFGIAHSSVPPLRQLAKTFQTGATPTRAKLSPRPRRPAKIFLSTRKARHSVCCCFSARRAGKF
jgi:hypothetical protein